LLTLRAVLELNGYKVEAAHSGAEALRKLKDSVFHLVITDMRMETENAGFAVTEGTKRSLPLRY
jgi:CheY-like chemotaxis protein